MDLKVCVCLRDPDSVTVVFYFCVRSEIRIPDGLAHPLAMTLPVKARNKTIVLLQ
jgi:hypothetical protein